MKPNYLAAFLLLLFAVQSAGCATVPQEGQSDTPSNKDAESINHQAVTPSDEDASSIDPYENVNRPLYNFTKSVDRNVLEPVADSYIKHVPLPVQHSVGNFYDNLAYPNVILNGFLQGKMLQGTEDILRFVLNSTIGLAGLFDVATPMGLQKHDEDFGQTLGVWGVDNKSYMYLPILGPSSNRDVWGLPVTIASNVLFYAAFVIGAPITVPLGILAVIDKRARHAEDLRVVDQAALDPYLFVREAYWQQRKHLVFDGNPPPEIYDNIFENDLSGIPEINLYTEPCLGTPLQHTSITQQSWHPPFIPEEHDNKQEKFSSHSEKDCSHFVHEAKKRDQNILSQTGDSHLESE